MDYNPDYPIVQRHLTRIKTRRRSAQPGGPGRGRRSGHTSTSAASFSNSGLRRTVSRTGAAQRPIRQRTLLLGLAGLVMASAVLLILLGPSQLLQADSLAQISNSLAALFTGARTR